MLLLKLVGVKNGKKNRNWLIFATAATMLSVRTVFGLLYGFGCMPYPVKLPFLGSNGSLMDVMSFTLILICAWENKKILEWDQMDTAFVPAEELLGFHETYIVMSEHGYRYKKESDDEVDIIRETGEIHCNAEWYYFLDRAFGAFTTQSVESVPKRFILEYEDGKWILPEDTASIIQQEIYEQYICANRPNCMDGEVKYRDNEEVDYENFEDL